MKQIYNFINKYKKELIIILILIIISICVYYFYYIENFITEGFFTTTTPIIGPKWEQLGGDIYEDIENYDKGHPVSLSNNGKIVAIGSPYYNSGSVSGSVKVFEWNETNWIQLGNTINGTIGYGFAEGYSISLSANGKIIAIGAPYIGAMFGGEYKSGFVKIYKLNENNINNKIWEQMGTNITNSKFDVNSQESDYSGAAVSLSANGNIIAIGTPYNKTYNNENLGCVRIYKYQENNWIKLGSDINSLSINDRSGYSVSLSDEGKIVAIGAPYNNDKGIKSGQVRVYEYNGNSWIQLGQNINGEAANYWSGYSVSLSADGKIVAIGAPNTNNSKGQVRIYKLNETTINTFIWQPLGISINGEATNEKSGYSVSLNNDGKIVAIRSFNNNNNAKHIKVYQWNESEWVQLGDDIAGKAENQYYSGSTVSLSFDGSIVAFGAYENNQGFIRIYKITPINCVGSFVDKGECSKTCGGGKQKQIYEITTSAHFGGKPCPYEEGKEIEIDCNTEDCPPINCVGSFEIEGSCKTSENCGYGEQTEIYKISTQAEFGGKTCPYAHDYIREIPCDSGKLCPIDCKGEWSVWSKCDKDCIGGSQTRTYKIITEPKHNGEKCPYSDGETEKQDCNTEIPCHINCVGEFSEFKECSRECGGGKELQIYNIKTEARNNGEPCPNTENEIKSFDCNTQPCPTYPENTTIKEALKESNDKIQNIRYDIINRQEELDLLTKKFNQLNKNISKIKTTSNYIPNDKTLNFY